MNHNRISSDLSRPKKVLPTTNKVPVMATSYIYKLKIKAQLREKVLVKWDMLIHHVPTVNIQSQSFDFNILISCHGRFKATKKSSSRMPWNYQSWLTRVPVIKIHVICDFSEQVDYILVMTFSLGDDAINCILTENKNNWLQQESNPQPKIDSKLLKLSSWLFISRCMKRVFKVK